LVTDRFNANAFAWGQSDTTVNEGKKPMELAWHRQPMIYRSRTHDALWRENDDPHSSKQTPAKTTFGSKHAWRYDGIWWGGGRRLFVKGTIVTWKREIGEMEREREERALQLDGFRRDRFEVGDDDPQGYLIEKSVISFFGGLRYRI